MHNKIAAGVLAILLGGIGIHKFYLGQTGRGILYLLFFWTGIPALIGLIEGIIYLTMTDEVFDSKFNAGTGVSSRSAMTNLTQLKSLFDQGILTPEEYETRRAQLVQKI
jgi:TM2 domain-containing membrane protein YozV